MKIFIVAGQQNGMENRSWMQNWKSLFWTLHLQVGQRFNSHCVMKKEAIAFASYVCLSMVNIPLIPK